MRRQPDEPIWVVVMVFVIVVLLAIGVTWYSEVNDCEYNAATKILDCPRESNDD